mmetsp:Transcript_24183/g.71701  ORF Transcript_24183/g.71701 Transcript_24183/m.71701 type:complete len:467 (-) Transcript_24183:67-1467(-)
MALAHSWMRSAACMPMMCTATTSKVSLRKMTLAMPSPSPSASAFELALKLPCAMPISQPSFSARSLACSSVGPTMAISGWVKHAAGTASWLSTCSCPHMFSTAEMPCADAACASIILPLRSPMHQSPSMTLPSLSSARILSSTGTKPRFVSTLTFSRPSPSENGFRPVHTITASTSIVSTCSFVFASIILTVAGRSPGMPGVTSDANTFVYESIARGRMRIRSASCAIWRSKKGIILGIASMKVTSEPSAVYTSENSSPMYPDPMIAIQSGTHSSLSASSEVKTVLPSVSTPGGTKGTEPVARMTFFASMVFPAPTSSMLVGPAREPFSSKTVTPRAVSEPRRLPCTRLARLFAWSATPCRSYVTAPSSLTPIAARCLSFCMSRTRPEAARRALDGTQPRLTHVPPTSSPAHTATLSPRDTACSAAPWPPTPQPTMTRSKSGSAMRRPESAPRPAVARGARCTDGR